MFNFTGEPEWDLATLNTFVADQENVMQGPLVKIGNNRSKTALSIDDEQPDGKPAKNAVITTGPLPAGATKIGTGTIFISGVLAVATAYRPA